MELADFTAWATLGAALSPDDPMRGQIQTVQRGARLPAGYAFRQAIAVWLGSDDDGTKAAWLKGS